MGFVDKAAIKMQGQVYLTLGEASITFWSSSKNVLLSCPRVAGCGSPPLSY